MNKRTLLTILRKMNALIIFLIILCAINSVCADKIDCAYFNKLNEPCYCDPELNLERILCQNVTFLNNTKYVISGVTVQLRSNRLYIMNTSIERIESNAFSRFFVEEIRIYDNALLQKIDNNAFSGEIKWLLIENNIKLTQENIFELTSKLMPTEGIYIANSRLQNIPANAFASNSKVKIIKLHNNSIETLPNNDVFSSLIGLHHLNLSYNKINKVEALSFDSHSPLRLSIDLRHNMLTENSFENTIMSMLSKDMTIYLSENNFTTLPQHSFERLVNGTRNKLIFNWDTINHFECDSRMKWVQSYLNSFDQIWCSNLNKTINNVTFMDTVKPCENFPKDIGCVCFPETLRVVCSNNALLSRINLKSVGKNLNEYYQTFEELYIRNTSIDVIETNTFGINTRFISIYFSDNQKLTTIQPNSINVVSTTSMYIINNPVLSFGLLELPTNSTQLTTIYFDRNKLHRIPENSFYSRMLSNVETISLESQNVDEVVIEKNSFGLLPNLRHLHINNKNLRLTENSVNLSVTHNSLGDVTVSAAYSNINQWNSKFIVQPEKSSLMGVTLDLYSNPINLGENAIFDQFNEFFDHQRNKLIVSNTIRDCDCTVAKQLLSLNSNYTRVVGMICSFRELCAFMTVK